MKYIYILGLCSFLIGCSKEPTQYDYNLTKDDVICKEVKRKDEFGRYGVTVVKITKVCSFIETEVIDKTKETQLNKLKETVEKAQKDL